MNAYLEVRSRHLPELVTLDKQRATIGRSPANDVVLADPAVSKLHALLEIYAGEWCIRDVGSANGTFVNGRAVNREVRLHSGDEIVVGGARLIFRSSETVSSDHTERADGPPDVTRREKDVLIALCRPLLSTATFAQPASIREIATALVVSDAAVKFHLANLYDKFQLLELSGNRRVQLANEAIRRRAITLGDLSQPEPGPPSGTAV